LIYIEVVTGGILEGDEEVTEVTEALQVIVDFLQRECGEGDMASVRINNQGDFYLSVGVCRDDPPMNANDFAAMVTGASE
jgi:hypothetical protein